MSRSRCLRFRFVVFAIVGLLLAQWAVAAYACVVRAAPEQAATHVECEGAGPATSGALCHKHCIGDEGGSRVDATALVALPVDPQGAYAGESVPLANRAAAQTVPAPGHPPPPITILLHRFLT